MMSPHRVKSVTEGSVIIMLIRNAKNGTRKFPKNSTPMTANQKKITSL